MFILFFILPSLVCYYMYHKDIISAKEDALLFLGVTCVLLTCLYFVINAVKIKTDSDNITLYSLNQAELFRDDLIKRQREYMMSINSSKQVEILNNILNAVTDLVTITDK